MCGKCDSAVKGCTVECVSTYGKGSCILACCEYEGTDIRASEGIVTDMSDSVTDGNAVKRLNVSEYTVSDCGNGLGKNIVTALSAGEEDNGGQVLIKENAFNSGEVFAVFIYRYLSKRGAAREDTGNLRYVCRKMNACKRGTVVEYVLTEYKITSARLEVDSLKLCAIAEGGSADRSYGSGNCNLTKERAALECTVSDCGYTAILLNPWSGN